MAVEQFNKVMLPSWGSTTNLEGLLYKDHRMSDRPIRQNSC